MSKLPAEILAGRHDDEIDDITQAIVARLSGDELDTHWVVTVQGEDFRRSDLTFGSLRRFESESGKNSNTLDISRASAIDLGVLAACWLHQHGTAWDDAMAKVEAMSAEDISVDVRTTPAGPKG